MLDDWYYTKSGRFILFKSFYVHYNQNINDIRLLEWLTL